jgi:hypothetical protein
MAALTIRPDFNDHLVVADLLAPRAAGLGTLSPRPIDRLIVDATTAHRRPQFASAAAGAGIPLLVDPMTHLLGAHPADSFSKLPYGCILPSDLETRAGRTRLIEQATRFQVEQGASTVIPPYLHLPSPSSPRVETQLLLLEETAGYMTREGLHLPALPVLAVSRGRFAARRHWSAGLDILLTAAEQLHPAEVMLAFSGSRATTFEHCIQLMTTIMHVAQHVPVSISRPGMHAQAMIAAGAIGYETGIGWREWCDLPAQLRDHRRPAAAAPVGGARGPYVDVLQRSIHSRAFNTLLTDRPLRGRLICPDSSCCPNGVQDMVSDHRRHTVHSRAHQLRRLEAMPRATWRLRDVVAQAEQAATVAAHVHKFALRGGLGAGVYPDVYRNLAMAAEQVRSDVARHVA